MMPEAYLAERNALQNIKFPSAQLLPGVDRLIKHLKQSGVPIAVRSLQCKSRMTPRLQRRAIATRSS
jgi:beta-phosphoglucomutase-like phosphatase (HAD superfamily)